MHRSVQLVVGNFGCDALALRRILKIDERTSSEPVEGHQRTHGAAAEAAITIVENRDNAVHGDELKNDQ